MLTNSDITLAALSRCCCYRISNANVLSSQASLNAKPRVKCLYNIYKVTEEIEDAMKVDTDPEFEEKVIMKLIIREPSKFLKSNNQVYGC